MARASRAQRRLRGTRQSAFRRLRLIERLEPRTLLTATPDSVGLDWESLWSGHGSVCQCPVCTGVGLDEIPEEVDTSGDGDLAESLASLPLLSSRPSATAKLFLDFDGHFQASWGSWSNVTTPAYDRDGDPTSFSASELSSIEQIWRRVAEDFAPFNIDVTTVAPGSLANRVVAHIAIGGSSYDWYGRSAGGVAYVGGFYNSAPNVGYVFEENLGNGNPKYVAEAASHEAGHLFGLQHQAKWSGTTLVESYNSGGNGWAPIMGLGYYQERTTWHNGPTSFGSTSYQDDLAILAGSNNAFGYVPDDFGNTRSTAAPLSASGGSFQVSGLIGRHDDVDVFSFTTQGGQLSVQLAVNSVGPNLDAVLEVWDTVGIVATAAPTNSLGASLTASLGAGTYYVVARSMGDFGNMGQYTLTGTLPTSQTAPEITVLSGTTSLTSSQTIDFGSTPQGTDISRTFTVRNDGSATLNLTPLDPQSLPVGFQLVSNLGATVLAPGASTSFTVRLDGSVPGTFGGVLAIVNNDADENPFELALAGSVVAPDTSPPIAQFAAVVPNPRNSPVGRHELTFNEPVSGVDLADLRLTRNGQSVDLSGNILTGTGTSYTVDLTNFTAAEGAYSLTLIASGSGIVDSAGNPLAADATVTWTTDTTRPVAQFAAVVPNPRNSAVGSVALTFSETVTGLNLADLRLTRDGQSVSLSGNLLSGSGANYTLNLANFTAVEGNYVLTLVAGNSGIVDGVGNSLDTNASVAWSADTTAPTVQFGQVAPNPRNSAVGPLAVIFSEAVSGFDLADLQLTRGGEVISLAGELLVGSGAEYTLDLSGFTTGAGDYVLTLVASSAGIMDSAGNSLTAAATVNWSTDTTAPTAQFDAVSPSPRNTSVGSLELAFSEPIAGLDLADLRLTRNGEVVDLFGNLLAGGGDQYSVDLSNFTASEGAYVLTLVASGSGIVDSAGNLLASDASASWSTDTTAPTAQFDAVTPNPRNTSVSALELAFSEPIAGLELDDLELTRDGESIALTGSLLAGSGTDYTLDLSGVTAEEGMYVLTLVASGSGIVDSAGNLLASDASASWSTDTTAPTAQFDAVTPNPRNTSVSALELAFSEPIAGLDLADLRLARDGQLIALSGNLLSGSGTNYTIDLSNFTAEEGDYVLTLAASGSGIVDSVGNALLDGASVAWTTETAPPTAEFAAVAPNLRNTPVSALDLTFNKPVSGLDLTDLELTRDGEPVVLSGNLLVGSGASYTVDLSSFTADEGDYVLTLIASGSGITDSVGNPLAASVEVSWSTDTSPPTAWFADVAPDPRRTAVGLLDLTFSESVVGLDVSDLRLTRDGALVPLAGNLLSGSGANYTLDLAALTGSEGAYVLTLLADNSSIKDAAENAISSDASVSWSTDTTLPTAQFSTISPNPRNAAVGVIAISLTEPVTGLDLADLQLTRNGVVVPLAGNLLAGSGANYTLDLSSLTTAEGDYLLTLTAVGSGIADSAGNLLAGDAIVSWTTDTGAPTAQFTPVSPNPRNSAVDVLGLTFTEPVSGLDLADFVLTRGGAPVPLTGNRLAGDGVNYTIDLADVTADDGSYVLTLIAAGSGIADDAGNALTIDAAVAWTVETTPPTALFSAVSPNPRNTSVGSLAFTFSTPVSGVDLDDLQLTRNGQPIELTGNLLAGSGASYSLDLANFTGAAGNYVLTLAASGSGIADSLGNLLAADAVTSWTTDTTLPTAQFTAVSPNPRNSAVGSIGLTFSEDVTGLDLSDLQLTRGGHAVQLTGDLLAGAGRAYTLDLANFTATEGEYVLQLVAGGSAITDSAGNLLATDASVVWRVDTTQPLAQFDAVSPNPRNSAVGSLGLSFSEPVAGLDLSDLRLTRDGAPVELSGNLLAGSGANYTVDLSSFTASAGNYLLTLAAPGSGIVDGVGNPLVNNASVSWTTETTAPVAKFGAITPNPRSTPLDSLSLTFNKPVTGLDLADFRLTRGGEPVALSGNLLAGTGASYTLDLASFTAAPGNYSLALVASGSGITDDVGNSLASDAAVVWSTDTSVPTAQFAAVSPSPRSTPVAAVALTFSELVTGVNLADLQLTRNGQPVALAGNLLSGSGSQYTLDLANFTALEGSYTLTLVAQGSGIADGVGNLLSADTSVSWMTDTTAPTTQFSAISPNPRNTPVGVVDLIFSEPVAGFDLADLSLTRDGESISLSGNILSGSGAHYSLDLSNFSAPEGNYVLTLVASSSGITDSVGNPFAVNAAIDWSTDTTSPIAAFGTVTPSPRRSPVEELSLTFSEPVTGLGLSDLHLWRDGQQVDLVGDILSGGGANYTLDLAGVTALDGEYLLTLTASGSGITDGAGNPLGLDASVAWTTETSSPLAQFGVVASPRNVPVDLLSISFSKPVSGLDLADLRLTRNGALVELAGNTLSGSDADYTLDLTDYTALPGAYSLLLVASGSGIADSVGNLLLADAVVSWTTESTPPTAQFASIHPNPRNSAVDALALTFSEPVSGLDLGDLQLTRDGQIVALAGDILQGSGLSYSLLLGSHTAVEGEYVLTLRAAASEIADAAGNLLATDAVANWTVDTTAPQGQFATVAPNPRHTPLTSIGLSFSETVSGLDLADLQLTRNGEAVPLAGSLLTGSGVSYTLDLANFTGTAGDYVLTLGAGGSGIADIAGNALSGDVAVAWTTDTSPPTAQFDPVTPNPRRAAVLALGLTFSEVVSGVDLSDLQLTRNGQPVPLTGNLLTGSGATYRVDLANFTAVGGNYQLTLVVGGSGIVDLAGNVLVADVSVSWTTDITAPVAQFAQISPNPRNTPVGMVELTFSESVTGVELADFRLLRDGEPVALAGELLAGSGMNYTLDLANFTAAPGSYVLTLPAVESGIQDGAGNLLTVDAAVSWTTETTGPTAEFTAVAPNPRNTAVGSIGLAFNKPVSGLDLADLLLTRDGEPVALEGASLSGSGANYAIDLASFTTAAGHYVLSLKASGSGITDAVGNTLTSDATASWTTDTTIPSAGFAAIMPNPRNTAVGTLHLMFSESVSGLDLADLQLLRGGEVVALAGDILSGSGANYSVDLTSFTATAGDYSLTLRAAGSAIRDAAGNLLASDATATWSTDTTAPTAQFAAVTPNPRNRALDTLEISFSELVTGFDLANLQLTRDGEEVALAGNLLAGSGSEYVLDVSSVTASPGDYMLSLVASGAGITDSVGNALVAGASVSWTTDTTVPTAQFAPVSPNPRNAAVGFLDLLFSESVSGLDLADLQLTRNGTSVPLAGDVLTGSGASYSIDLGSFTAAAGEYVLTLAADSSGISDEAGNDLLGNASVTWTTDTTPPTAQFAAVTPNPRNSAVGILGLTFSESVTGVDLSDLQLTRNGQPVPLSGNLLAGSGASYSLNLANHTSASGNYILTLSSNASGIADAAGNPLSAGASVSWTTDATPPTAQFAAVAPDPRETAVGTLGLTFSEAVSGVDLADLRLTRNGAAVPLTGNILSGSGANYALSLANFTAAEGVYVLTLVASGSGISDSLGNPLAANASVEWTLKLNTDPQTPSSPSDVNGDGVVNTSDLLAIVNWLVRNGNRPGAEVPANFDVNGDGVIDVLDLLAVVNEIIRRSNRPAGSPPAASEPVALDEGEGEATDQAIAEAYGPSPQRDETLLSMLAADTADEHARRRRSN
jgi:hypothetical protein